MAAISQPVDVRLVGFECGLRPVGQPGRHWAEACELQPLGKPFRQRKRAGESRVDEACERCLAVWASDSELDQCVSAWGNAAGKSLLGLGIAHPPASPPTRSTSETG